VIKVPIPDELLDAYGEFYNSQFVRQNMPWVRMVPFAEWVTRQLAEKGMILQ
jgi:hypothetical protein